MLFTLSHCESVAKAASLRYMRMTIIRLGASPLYVCNCNGIREREVRAAIDAGATRPAEVFRHKGCQAQCAKCVCEMRQMIQDSQEALAYAAE